VPSAVMTMPRPDTTTEAAAADMLAAATTYATAGWWVFPLHTPRPGGGCSCSNPKCENVGKHPHTPNGFKDATLELDVIRGWWGRWPAANIGCDCGRSGLAVADVDPRHDGHRTAQELERRHGRFPRTVEAITGGGGRHLVYRASGAKLPSTLGEGVDVRAAGTYIVLSPSMHEIGNQYRWHHDPAGVPLASEPAWWAAACTHTRKAQARVVGGEVIAAGFRNQTLASMAGSMRRAGFDESAIAAALLATNETRCRPPLGEDEVYRIAASISRYEPAVLGRPLPVAVGRAV
jgi:hypothetical protein